MVILLCRFTSRTPIDRRFGRGNARRPRSCSRVPIPVSFPFHKKYGVSRSVSRGMETGPIRRLRPFDPSTLRQAQDNASSGTASSRFFLPASRLVSLRRATRAGPSAFSPAPGSRGPGRPSLSVRPPCAPGVALPRLPFPSLRRRERGARAKGRSTPKGRREGGLPFLGIRDTRAVVGATHASPLRRRVKLRGGGYHPKWPSRATWGSAPPPCVVRAPSTLRSSHAPNSIRPPKR